MFANWAIAAAVMSSALFGSMGELPVEERFEYRWLSMHSVSQAEAL